MNNGTKNIVVILHRLGWRYPRLTITVETRCKSEKAANAYIVDQIMGRYAKRIRGRMGQWSSMRVPEFRVVDEVGLKRLQAASKASVTIRRKRAAQKAAATRAKRKAANMARTAAARAANAARFHNDPPMFPVAPVDSLN